ncbi:MAG: hypothetical protein JNG85_17975 [Spirochaetaceae bacterium]|nr:hypothetical protein [Spirochaetaceae bacterium]
MGIRGFLRRLSGRERAAAEARPEPEQPGPLASLELSEPLDALAADFFFPFAFAIEGLHIRVRPVALAAGPEAFPREPVPVGPWFFWKADTQAGRLGGYWSLPPAAPPRDAAAAASWSRTAAAVAGAAAARLKAKLSATPSLAPTAFSAGPCPAPALAGRSAFLVDFRYAARGVFRRGCAVSAPGYPLVLARALGAETAGLEADPIGALAAASRALLAGGTEAAWGERVFRFAAPSGGREYLPLYDCFNLLSDADLRLVVQNRLLAKAPGPALGALFAYRTRADGDPEGAEKVVPAQSLDRSRLDPLLPEAVFREGRLDPGNAASDVDDFLRRNDAAYEDLFRAARGGSLALSARGSELVRGLYVALVYAARRRAFDELVRSGRPGTDLAGMPERVFRRAVDSSGARGLAAAAYGSPETLATVSKWCSRAKREELARELERIEASLAAGIADLDGLAEERLALAARAEALLEEERREAAAGGGRRAGPGRSAEPRPGAGGHQRGGDTRAGDARPGAGGGGRRAGRRGPAGER